MGSFSNSLDLVKASANVLRLDKELMVFPLMSGIATLLVGASFVVPFIGIGEGQAVAEVQGTYGFYFLGFLFYLAQYTVIFFFNSALVGAALIRLDGGDPTVGDGLAIAAKRFASILGYAAIAATVGMILRAIAGRGGIVARIVSGFAGMAWTLATYLAVPILVTKNIGPIDAVKESAALFKRTWGEQVVGNFGMGAVVFVAGIVWTAVSAGLLWGAGSIMPQAIVPAIGVAVLGYVFLGLAGSALNGIYTAALYRYAVTGEAGHFDPRIMGGAFRQK